MTVDIKLLDRLETEHRKVERILKKLEKATEADKQRPLVDELLASMAQHMRVEETEVYPALLELDEEMGEEAQIEHDLARDGLQKLNEMIGQPGFGAAVAMVQAGIEHHVEDEEKEAFPKLRKQLGGRTRGASAAKRPAAKKSDAKTSAAKTSAAKKSAGTRSATKQASGASKSASTRTAAAKRAAKKAPSAGRAAAKTTSSAKRPAKKAAARR
jgi:hemerythrin-like domain-containing protein